MEAWVRFAVCFGVLAVLVVVAELALIFQEEQRQTKCLESVAGSVFITAEKVESAPDGLQTRGLRLGDCVTP